MKPPYIGLYESGELKRRGEAAIALLSECRLCPRQCGVNRLEDKRGFCRTGRKAVVASYNPHYGEESPLVGKGGSGTIFFAGCNLGCRFCQNFDISHDGKAGIEAEPDQLAGVMLSLQDEGCHNINFVTPSHVVPQILEALPLAIDYGLKIPLVYNTSSYDLPKTLKLLDGVMDIYMPDVKMWDPKASAKYLQAPDYPKRAQAAIREMHRQVGDLSITDAGIAERGMLVRHLVMPDDIAGTGKWMQFLAGLSKNTYLNLMDQYHPCGEIDGLPELDRMITTEEFQAAERAAKKHGLTRLDARTDRFFYQFLKK